MTLEVHLYRLVATIQRSFVVLVLLFLIGPLLTIVPLSFSSGSLLVYPLPGLSLRWYANLISNPAWLQALKHSGLIAVTATVLSTSLGTLAAFGLSSSRLRFRTFILSFIFSPMIVPTVVAAVGIFFYYSKLGLASSFSGIILAHTAIALPLVVITVTSSLQTFDKNLSRAAASLGASPLRGFRTVTLPLIAPGVMSGAIFAFSTSWDELIIAMFLAAPDQRTLPRQLFENIQFNIDPTIASFATVMVIVSALLLTTIGILQRRGPRNYTKSNVEERLSLQSQGVTK